MRLSHIIEEYYDAFLNRYGDTALPEQIKALNAILSCRTPDAGQIYTACPDCNHTQHIHYPVATVIVPIVKIMKQANGSIGSKINSFPSSISW